MAPCFRADAHCISSRRALRRSEAARIIEQLVACTRSWRNTFDACGVSERDSDTVANAFRRAGDIGIHEVERPA